MNWQSVTTQSYYRIEEDGGNVRDLSAPLIVNCSGVIAYDSDLSSSNPAGRHDYYLMILLHGRMDARADEREFVMSAGDAVIYTPERPYAYHSVGGERIVYLWVHFTGSAVEETLARCGLCTGELCHPDRTGEMESDIAAIHRLFISRPMFCQEEISAHLSLLLTHLGRAVGQNSLHQERIQTSLSYLNRHYAEPLKLERLASMEYLSVSRYSALFRQLTGRSPQQYLIDLRLRNAQELLKSTDLSISEVARSVGYEDALYFSRLFRRRTGAPPSGLRKKN